MHDHPTDSASDSGHGPGEHTHGEAEAHAHSGHGHHHGHAHHTHAPKDFGPAFRLGIALNLGFVALEAGYGWAAQSMALIADAGHNLSDVLGLAVAWIAAVLVKRRPSPRYTYGLRDASILAALFNAAFLLVAAGGIAVEALRRFAEPAPVAGLTVMAVAGIGIAVNGITAWLFASGQEGDLNIRGTYLHMLADAAVSLGVVLAGLAILGTGMAVIDPLVSLAIAGLIVWSGWGLLRESLALALGAVPPGIDPDAVRRCLAERPGVRALHDLHIWPLGTTETALTAHLVMEAGPPAADFLSTTAAALRTRFDITHTTLQIEIAGETACTLDGACAA